MDDRTKAMIMKQREILKGYSTSYIQAEDTGEAQGMDQPNLTLKKSEAEGIVLKKEFGEVLQNRDILSLMEGRKSVRKYTDEDLTMEELAFLLWTTQGIKKVIGKRKKASIRMVPSAGARHPFETYLFINRVLGLEPGLYHYDAENHTLEFLYSDANQKEKLTKALCDQPFAGEAPVTFVWSAVPYRTEWRYAMQSVKYMLIDAGHVCENLYLAGAAVGCGVCAIGAYDQDLLDELLNLSPGPSADNDYECAVYAAAVGKTESIRE